MKASDWAGIVGDAWAEFWPLTDRLLAPVNAALVEAVAALVPADAALRILDIGCGAGTTTLALAGRLAAPRITGIDISPALVTTAHIRAAEAGLTEDAGANVRPDAGLTDALMPAASASGWCAFLEADASRWAGSESFDLIVSRHGVMFFDDPIPALAHIRSLAAPGAPLVFSCFRDRALNPWASELDALLPDAPAPDPFAPGPFAFADRDRVAGLLALAGWSEAQATPLDFPYLVGEGPAAEAEACAFLQRIGPAASAIRTLPEAERAALENRIGAFVAKRHVDGQVTFPAAAWIWTARA